MRGNQYRRKGAPSERQQLSNDSDSLDVRARTTVSETVAPMATPIAHTHSQSHSRSHAPSSRGRHGHHAHAPPADESHSSTEHPECLICVMPIIHHTLASCSHSTQICATCALRLKLFVKRKSKDSESKDDNDDNKPNAWECPFCRQAWQRVCFTREMHSQSDHSALLSAFADNQLDYASMVYDDSVQVYFQDALTQKQFFKLRSIYCPLCDVPSQSQPVDDAGDSDGKAVASTKYFSNIAGLNKHLQYAHQRFSCEACITTRKVFIHEHEFFTQLQLLQHFKEGSRPTASHGPIEPHPFCQFCNQPFFSSDELYAHLSNHHRTCRFCQSDGSQKWFRNDNALKRHFTRHHYYCEQGDCKGKIPDYAAFRDLVSLKAHQLAAHVDKSQLSQAQLRAMARIDVGFHDNRLPTHSGTTHSHSESHSQRSQSRHHHHARHEEPNYIVDDDDDDDAPSVNANDEEQFPVLQSTSIEQRARLANDDIKAQSKAQSKDRKQEKKSQSMQRSYSQPQSLARTVALTNAFDADDFPSLSTGLAPRPAAPFIATHTNSSLRIASGVSPAAIREDYPSLPTTNSKSTNKLNALNGKQGKPVSAMAGPRPAVGAAAAAAAASPYSGNAASASLFAPPPARSSTTSPLASPRSSSPDNDPRTVSHVPLPLPPPVSQSESNQRNQQLIATIRATLSNNTDVFSEFREKSSAYRNNAVSAAEFLQYFYRAFGHDSEPVECERLLIELIALLPDESKRQSLHSEYAKQKVWQKLAMMKKSKPVEIATHSKSPITSVPFESRASKPLKRASDEDEKVQQRLFEAAERERKEKEILARREEKKRAEDAAKAEKQERLRLEREKRRADEKAEQKREAERALKSSDDAAVDASEEEHKEQQRLEDERIAAEQVERERELRAKVLEAANKKQQQQQGKPKKSQSTPTGTWITSPPMPRADYDEPNPPLSAFAMSASSTPTSVPDPSMIDVYMSRMVDLSSQLPESMMLTLRFLSTLLLCLIDALTLRHPPSLTSPNHRRFLLTDDARQRLHSMVPKVRFNHLLEFSRLSQVGLMPNSVTSLSGAVSTWRRYIDDEMINDWIHGILHEMKSQELFLLYEWVHALLDTYSDPSQSDVVAAIERQQIQTATSTTSLDDRKLVPLQRKADSDDERERGAGGIAGKSKNAKKGGKQLLFYGGQGFAAQ